MGHFSARSSRISLVSSRRELHCIAKHNDAARLVSNFYVNTMLGHPFFRGRAAKGVVVLGHFSARGSRISLVSSRGGFVFHFSVFQFPLVLSSYLYIKDVNVVLFKIFQFLIVIHVH